MTYLWIALGSAFGGMARFWLSALAAKAWGTAFPWGTILINIGGSFVIGFFGTLTAAADGRFPVPADLRAFVMVGLCGGFTTFSSFSLQTLDLLRDGRMGEAAANVALSAALCLGAVAAGHYGAAALGRGRAIEQAAATGTAEPGQEVIVLALLDRPEAAPAALSTAGRPPEAAMGGTDPSGGSHAATHRPDGRDGDPGFARQPDAAGAGRAGRWRRGDGQRALRRLHRRERGP